MKKNFLKRLFLVSALMFILSSGFSQKGSLFIIGGGARTPELLTDLIQTANPSVDDYIVILTMATSVPDESFESIRSQLSGHCKNAITGFNFNKTQANEHKEWIDSVRNAKLIYVVGGDQNKFMEVVRGSVLYDALHQAYNNGSTISGTSAGAAIMSQIMITGEEKDKKNKDSFREIRSDNVVTSPGMGFIDKAIIDQHFIQRSRYNRLISVLSDHPDKMVIGIDESTAIVVTGKKARVVGESQVVVISGPKKVKSSKEKKVSFKNARLSLFAAGDQFKIK